MIPVMPKINDSVPNVLVLTFSGCSSAVKASTVWTIPEGNPDLVRIARLAVCSPDALDVITADTRLFRTGKAQNEGWIALKNRTTNRRSILFFIVPFYVSENKVADY